MDKFLVKTPTNQSKAPKAAKPPFFNDVDIVLNNGSKVKAESHLEGKVVVLYFSAGWSQPSIDFTAKLKAFYEKLAAAGKNFEVIFVSCDRTEEDLVKHYKDNHGKWVYLPYGAPEIQEYLQKYEVEIIPSLKVIKPNGKCVVKDGYEQIMIFGQHFEWLFSKWSSSCSILDWLKDKDFDWKKANDSWALVREEATPDKKKKKADKVKKYNCEICNNYSTDNHVAYLGHLKSHTKPPPKKEKAKNQVCRLTDSNGQQCKQSSIDNQNLRTHIISSNHFNIQCSCLVCLKQFALSGQDTHSRNHVKIKCLHCGKTFGYVTYGVHVVSFAYEIQCASENRVFSRAFDQYIANQIKFAEVQSLLSEVNSEFANDESKSAKFYAMIDPRELLDNATKPQLAKNSFYGGMSIMNDQGRTTSHNSEASDQQNRTDEANAKVARMLEIYADGYEIIVVELKDLSDNQSKIYEAGFLQALNSTGHLTNVLRGSLFGKFDLWHTNRHKLALFGCGVFDLVHEEYLKGNYRKLSKKEAQSNNVMPVQEVTKVQPDLETPHSDEVIELKRQLEAKCKELDEERKAHEKTKQLLDEERKANVEIDQLKANTKSSKSSTPHKKHDSVKQFTTTESVDEQDFATPDSNSNLPKKSVGVQTSRLLSPEERQKSLSGLLGKLRSSNKRKLEDSFEEGDAKKTKKEATAASKSSPLVSRFSASTLAKKSKGAQAKR